jgi:hypothetical protein
VIGDSQGVIRDFQHSYQSIDTFPVAIASDWPKATRSAQSLFGGAMHPVPIDYAGPPGTVPDLSYWQVYENKFPPPRCAARS